MLSISEAFRKTIEAYGQIDIVINNAGILNDIKWELEININLVSCGGNVMYEHLRMSHST